MDAELTLDASATSGLLQPKKIQLKSGVTTVCGRTVKGNETTPGVNYVVMDWAGEVPWVVWHRGPRGVVSDPVTLSQPKSR